MRNKGVDAAEDSTTTAILLTGAERAERRPRDRKPIGASRPGGVAERADFLHGFTIQQNKNFVESSGGVLKKRAFTLTLLGCADIAH